MKCVTEQYLNRLVEFDISKEDLEKDIEIESPLYTTHNSTLKFFVVNDFGGIKTLKCVTMNNSSNGASSVTLGSSTTGILDLLCNAENYFLEYISKKDRYPELIGLINTIKMIDTFILKEDDEQNPVYTKDEKYDYIMLRNYITSSIKAHVIKPELGILQSFKDIFKPNDSELLDIVCSNVVYKLAKLMKAEQHYLDTETDTRMTLDILKAQNQCIIDILSPSYE